MRRGYVLPVPVSIDIYDFTRRYLFHIMAMDEMSHF